MALMNYILVGVLGTILAVALYAAKSDFSRSGANDPLDVISRV
ncbi:MAG: hypothetical protein ABJN72_12370 [Sulfitobacter sp.]